MAAVFMPITLPMVMVRVQVKSVANFSVPLR